MNKITNINYLSLRPCRVWGNRPRVFGKPVDDGAQGQKPSTNREAAIRKTLSELRWD